MMIGILLKDNVARHWKALPAEVQHYIMELGPLVLEDPSLALREVCGSLISVMLAQTTLAGWPTLIENLISVLDNENPNLVQGALRTLSKLCEDHGRALSQVQPNFTHQPTDLLIPKLYELLQSGKPDLMNMALICVSHVIVWQPTALLLTINDFFTVRFSPFLSLFRPAMTGQFHAPSSHLFFHTSLLTPILSIWSIFGVFFGNPSPTSNFPRCSLQVRSFFELRAGNHSNEALKRYSTLFTNPNLFIFDPETRRKNCYLLEPNRSSLASLKTLPTLPF